MHSALALVLASSLAFDGGVSTLYVECLPSDVPLAVQVDGGWFMPEARWARTNCRLAACEVFAAGSMEQADSAPSVAAWVGIAVSVLGTVVTTGFAVWQMSQLKAVSQP